MARTRGACSQGDRREKPTTFVRGAEVGAFPGGPIDGSLLLSYPDHVA